jgi:hypothetical protein
MIDSEATTKRWFDIFSRFKVYPSTESKYHLKNELITNHQSDLFEIHYNTSRAARYLTEEEVDYKIYCR